MCAWRGSLVNSTKSSGQPRSPSWWVWDIPDLHTCCEWKDTDVLFDCLHVQLNSENELDLLSILPKGWQPDFSPTMYPYMLMPSTRATFLARRYRFIIELDLSPSTGIVVRSQDIWMIYHLFPESAPLTQMRLLFFFNCLLLILNNGKKCKYLHLYHVENIQYKTLVGWLQVDDLLRFLVSWVWMLLLFVACIHVCSELLHDVTCWHHVQIGLIKA